MNIKQLSLNSGVASIICNDPNWNPELPPTIEDEGLKSLREDLLQNFEAVKELKTYEQDVCFGIKLKMYFDTSEWFSLRLAALKDFWNFLSIRIVPDLVYQRHGNNQDYYYKKPLRTWLRAIWWYAFLSWQGDEAKTREVLSAPIYTSDALVGLTERPGGNGTRIDLYKEILRMGSYVTEEQKNEFVRRQPIVFDANGQKKDNSDTLFRAVMRLNTSRSVGMEPALCQGGIQGYVYSLFADLGVTVNVPLIENATDESTQDGLIAEPQNETTPMETVDESIVPALTLDVDTLKACDRTAKGRIVIPDTVTSIASSAFKDCKDITEIMVPDSVNWIDIHAFIGCENLSRINIPQGVSFISIDAFDGCSSLQTISVDEENKNYSSLDGVLFNKDKTKLLRVPQSFQSADYRIPRSVETIDKKAFFNCTKLSQITIPALAGICRPTIYNMETFRGCSNLRNINVDAENKFYASIDGVLFSKDKTVLLFHPQAHPSDNYMIPDGVTAIGSLAFVDQTELKEIWIPDSLNAINTNAFNYSSSIRAIEVSPANENFTSIDGVLFNNDRIELIRFPQGRQQSKYTIPEGVTIIGNNAFSECEHLTEIVIPNSVNVIKMDSFVGCDNLRIVHCAWTNGDSLRLALFRNIDKPNSTLYVPRGLRNLYRNNQYCCDFGAIREE